MAKTKYTQNQTSSKMVEQNPQTTPVDDPELTRPETESECDELRRELGAAELRVRGLVDELEGFKEENAGLRKAKDGFLESLGELEGLRREILVLGEEKRVKETEKEAEIEALVEEKKAKETEIEALVEEKERVFERVGELEKEVESVKRDNAGVLKEKRAKETEIESLKGEFEEEKKVKEREIESLVGEKARGLERVRELEEEVESVKRDNVGVLRELDGLRSEFEAVVEEKKLKEREIESLVDEKARGLERVGELEKEVEGVKRDNVGVLKELDGLRSKFEAVVEEKKVNEREIESVKRVNEDVVRELEGLKSEFETLAEEKKVKEREVESLIGEKARNFERIEGLEKEVQIMKRDNEEVLGKLKVLKSESVEERKAKELEIEELKRVNVLAVQEKRRLEETGFRQESVIKELRSELDEIRGNVVLLQESNRDQLEKNVKLLSEISDLKNELESVINERDDVRAVLNDERINEEKLRVNLSEKNASLSSEISECKSELETVINERDEVRTVLHEEKMNSEKLQVSLSQMSIELENKYSKLVEEKGLVEKKLVEATEKIVELDGLLGLKNDMFESALTMLRKTTMQLSEENDKLTDEGVVVNERSVNSDMDSYMTELEAIRAALRSKEDTVGEMRQQMEKQKSFWTMVSSATTVLAAAVSLAYAAKAR